MDGVSADRSGPTSSRVGIVITVGLFAAAGYSLGQGVRPVASSRFFPWIVARSSGIAAFVAITVMVLVGLLFRRPVRTGGPVQRETLLRVHVSLGPALLALVATHIGALLADRYAGVTWRAVVIPFAATYRPGPVTYGLTALYLLAIVFASAGLAGRRLVRARWARVHWLAYPAFALVWAHGVLAGSDTATLRWMYIVAGLAVAAASVAAALRRPLGAEPVVR